MVWVTEEIAKRVHAAKRLTAWKKRRAKGDREEVPADKTPEKNLEWKQTRTHLRVTGDQLCAGNNLKCQRIKRKSFFKERLTTGRRTRGSKAESKQET